MAGPRTEWPRVDPPSPQIRVRADGPLAYPSCGVPLLGQGEVQDAVDDDASYGELEERRVCVQYKDVVL